MAWRCRAKGEGGRRGATGQAAPGSMVMPGAPAPGSGEGPVLRCYGRSTLSGPSLFRSSLTAFVFGCSGPRRTSKIANARS